MGKLKQPFAVLTDPVEVIDHLTNADRVGSQRRQLCGDFADEFYILTDVPYIYINYRKPDQEIKEFLIDVENCNSVEQIIVALKSNKKIILKPVSGNQGKGIYTLEENDNLIKIKKLEECIEIKKEQLNLFFEENIKSRGYAISPYFKSLTVNNFNTVFRMQINRGVNGKWQLIKFFPYINIDQNIDITNGMQGALITLREKMFLEQYYSSCYKEIEKKIQKLFKVFPLEFQKKYLWRLDSLGLDL